MTDYSGLPPEAIAVAYYKDGSVYDFPENWETAQTLANEGYKIQVLKDDGEYWTKERIQSLCDGELAAAIDCFGEGHIK